MNKLFQSDDPLLKPREASTRKGQTLKVFDKDNPLLSPMEPMEPVQCPICQDRGVVKHDVKLGHPDFGRFFPCPNPTCPTRMQNDADRHQRTFNGRGTFRIDHWAAEYDDWTFETFESYCTQRGAIDGKGLAWAASQMFVEQAGNAWSLADAALKFARRQWKDTTPRSSLVLTGGVGVGKTSLAISVTNALRANGQFVQFLRTRNLVREIQMTYDQDYAGPTEDQKLRAMCEIPVLVLDEFGIKLYSPHRLELIEDVMRHRDKNGLPFMATTNLTLEQFYEQWQPQVADIVAKAHWVPMIGNKLRDVTTSTPEDVF